MKVAHEKIFIKCIMFGVVMVLSSCVNSEQSVVADNKTNKNINEKDNDFQKYAIISKVYSDVMLNKYNKGKNNLDYLYMYADKELKKTITLSRKNILNTYESLDSVKNCEKSIMILDLVPSTSYELDDILEIDHKILNNGYVRSRMLVKGYEKINSYNFGTFKDFSLNCENGGCVITDILDSEGNSAKKLVNKFC